VGVSNLERDPWNKIYLSAGIEIYGGEWEENKILVWCVVRGVTLKN
jgi:hypothetical protein